MRFTLEVADDWLDALDDLIKLVAAQGDSSPEEVLEQTLCAQIKEQRTPQEIVP